MSAERRVCPCRAYMTESELFAAHRVPYEAPRETPLTAAEVRARYVAQRSAQDVLRDLADQERRLTVGGRG